MSQTPQTTEAIAFLEEREHGEIVTDAHGYPWQKTKGVLDGELVEMWIMPGREAPMLTDSLAIRFAPFAPLATATAPAPKRGSFVA